MSTRYEDPQLDDEQLLLEAILEDATASPQPEPEALRRLTGTLVSRLPSEERAEAWQEASRLLGFCPPPPGRWADLAAEAVVAYVATRGVPDPGDVLAAPVLVENWRASLAVLRPDLVAQWYWPVEKTLATIREHCSTPENVVASKDAYRTFSVPPAAVMFLLQPRSECDRKAHVQMLLDAGEPRFGLFEWLAFIIDPVAAHDAGRASPLRRFLVPESFGLLASWFLTTVFLNPQLGSWDLEACEEHLAAAAWLTPAPMRRLIGDWLTEWLSTDASHLQDDLRRAALFVTTSQRGLGVVRQQIEDGQLDVSVWRRSEMLPYHLELGARELKSMRELDGLRPDSGELEDVGVAAKLLRYRMRPVACSVPRIARLCGLSQEELVGSLRETASAWWRH